MLRSRFASKLSGGSSRRYLSGSLRSIARRQGLLGGIQSQLVCGRRYQRGAMADGPESEEAVRKMAAIDITDDMDADQKKTVREARKAVKEIEKRLKQQRKEAAAAAASGPILDLLTYTNVNKEPEQRYGDYKTIMSDCPEQGSGRTFTRVDALGTDKIGQTVWVRARVHNIRAVSKNAFIILRQRYSTAQAIASPSDASTAMIKWILKSISRESVVDVQGKVVAADVKACTQKTVELSVQRVYVVSRAQQPLPFLPDDAARPESEEGVHVDRVTRLDSRAVDLRVIAHQAIFRIQSGVCQLFRNHLTEKGFVEIHSPKLIAGASEGGAEVFKVDYFGRQACLAQSPQLYKQMAICGDMERVFEIGPVFRAETSHTHRHLTEFMGLDFEMAIDEHYHEVVRTIDHLFTSIFDGLQSQYGAELDAVGSQYPCDPFKYRPAGQNLVLTFPEGLKLLREAGVEIGDLDDLKTETERVLGKVVREKYDTDFFVLTEYPSWKRPFYTMPSPKNPDYCNSFDVFMRGEEIISGAQRIHDVELLEKRIRDAPKDKQVDIESIRDYINAFRFGAPPHGGAGVGLERVVMLFLNLGNVRETSMFPRDTERITP